MPDGAGLAIRRLPTASTLIAAQASQRPNLAPDPCLCDAGEERAFRRALERAGLGDDLDRAGMERLGFFVCERDLEDELVRCLGAQVVEEILAVNGKLGSFRTYQKQPAHRARATEEQLRGFLTNWKIRLAAPLVEALELGRVPRPLDGVLANV